MTDIQYMTWLDSSSEQLFLDKMISTLTWIMQNLQDIFPWFFTFWSNSYWISAIAAILIIFTFFLFFKKKVLWVKQF